MSEEGSLRGISRTDQARLARILPDANTVCLLRVSLLAVGSSGLWDIHQEPHTHRQSVEVRA